MIVPVEVRYRKTAVPGLFGRISANGRLAVAAGYVENIGRLAETGDASAQGRHDSLPFFYRQAEVAGAGRQIGVVKIIGLDAGLDECPHQFGKNRRIVVDTF